MIRGFFFTLHNFFVFVLFSLSILAGLSGCKVDPGASHPVICTPESSTVNIYRVPPKSWSGAIFDMAFPPIPTSIPPNPPNPPVPSNPTNLNSQQILGARYAAFEYLVNETERWSDTETIRLDDSSRTRITITFISPELLEAVFLNDVLRDGFITSGFRDQLQNMLNSVAARDELLFLLTVVTNNSNSLNPTPHTIKIPIENMNLNNAENLIVPHSHDDHNIEQIINTSSDPVFGYLAYPLTMLMETQCKWVLDPKYNTNIVITIPYLEIDGVNNNTAYSWTIPYVSLISPITPTNNMPLPFLPPGFDQNLMAPLAIPPSEINQINYLQDFARFIWNQITLANY